MDSKRNLAFYKLSEEDWTPEEFDNICNYCGNDPLGNIFTSRSYDPIYDNGEPQDTNFMWDWESYVNNLSKCTKVYYEDIFSTEVLFEL